MQIQLRLSFVPLRDPCVVHSAWTTHVSRSGEGNGHFDDVLEKHFLAVPQALGAGAQSGRWHVAGVTTVITCLLIDRCWIRASEHPFRCPVCDARLAQAVLSTTAAA